MDKGWRNFLIWLGVFIVFILVVVLFSCPHTPVETVEPKAFPIEDYRDFLPTLLQYC